VGSFERSIRGARYLAETFPVFWPNLGPGVYAAFHGCELDFREITSWTSPLVREWPDIARIRFDPSSPYYRAIDELMALAFERCRGRFMVGYTDLHGGLDCVADWRGRQHLCLDTIDAPERVHEMVRLADEHFLEVFDRYDGMLKAHRQPSVTWTGDPLLRPLHIPSCDFAALISPEAFDEFYLPSLVRETKAMTHNIYHLDGKDTIRHLDRILELRRFKRSSGWQGVGDDMPILQWLPLIKRMQRPEDRSWSISRSRSSTRSSPAWTPGALSLHRSRCERPAPTSSRGSNGGDKEARRAEVEDRMRGSRGSGSGLRPRRQGPRSRGPETTPGDEPGTDRASLRRPGGRAPRSGAWFPVDRVRL